MNGMIARFFTSTGSAWQEEIANVDHLKNGTPSPRITRPESNQMGTRSAMRTWSIVLLIALTAAIAVGLRAYKLDSLNLWGDEDITALAVQGILEKGFPQLPSGMIYFRSLLTSYIFALSAAIFDIGESALRLPSILASILACIAVFALGRRLFSTAAGASAALILAFSHWDIEFARHARMYEFFIFFFTFSLYAIYRGVFEGSRRWFFASFGLSICTIFVHILGTGLALIYFASAVRVRDNRGLQMQLFAAGTLLGVLGLFQFTLIKFGFAMPALGLQEMSLAAFAAFAFDLVMATVKHIGRLIPATFWAIAGFSVIALVLLRKWALPVRWQHFLLPLVVLPVLLLQKIFFAAVIMLFFLFFARNRQVHISSLTGVAAVVLIVLAFAGWSLAGWQRGDEIGATLSAWETIKPLIDFPRFYYLGFFYAFPLMSLVVAVSLAMMYHRSGKRQNNAAFFLFASFLVPITASGFLESRILEYRLNFHLNGLYVLLFAVAVCSAASELRQRLQRKNAPQYIKISGFVLLGALALLCCEQAYPGRIERVIERKAGDSLHRSTVPGSHVSIMPDHKSPGRYLAAHLQEGDVIVAMDWLNLHYYTGRVDYWLRSYSYAHQVYERDGIEFDIYTGTILLPSLANLRSLLAARQARSIWLVSASPYLETESHVSAEIREFLATQLNNRVHTGLDGRSAVYFYPPHCDTAIDSPDKLVPAGGARIHGLAR